MLAKDVNYCPCGDTVIQLFEEADTNDLKDYREHLKTFLKGSKKRFCIPNCINHLRTCENCESST